MRTVTAATTPNHLRFVYATDFWLYGAFGALFMVAGAIVMWLMANDVALNVDGGEFRYTRRFIGIYLSEEIAFSAIQIKTVGLDLVTALGGVYRSYEVALDGPDGLWRAWLVAADGDVKQAIVDGVKNALTDTSQRYEYTESSTVPGLILGGALICGGLYILAFIQAIVIAGDRQNGTITVSRRRLLLPVGVTQTLAIADIIRCKMETSIMRTTRGHRVPSYQVVLQVRNTNGGRADIPLSFGSAFTRESAELLEQSINSWLVTARQMPQRTGHFKR